MSQYRGGFLAENVAQAGNSTIPVIQPTLAAINWSAIVSTVGVVARDNTLVSAPVYRLDGELFATGFDDMSNGSIGIGIQLTEKLTLVPGHNRNSSGPAALPPDSSIRPILSATERSPH